MITARGVDLTKRALLPLVFAGAMTDAEAKEIVAAVRLATTERREWLTVEAAAKACGIPSYEINRRVADGSIPATRFGRKLIRINARDIEAYIERCRVVAREARDMRAPAP